MIEPEREYRNIPLRVTGIIRTVQGLNGYAGVDLVRSALHAGVSVTYALEPGDMSQYKLVLASEVLHSGQAVLYIIYVSGSKVYGVAQLIDWKHQRSEFLIREASYQLDANPYTQDLLAWFLAHLCDHFE